MAHHQWELIMKSILSALVIMILASGCANNSSEDRDAENQELILHLTKKLIASEQQALEMRLELQAERERAIRFVKSMLDN